MKYHNFEIRQETRNTDGGFAVSAYLIFCNDNYVHYAWNLADAKAIVDRIRADAGR